MVEGQFFGEYEVVEEIGRGGMSIIYKAKHPNLPKFVAIKVLSKYYSEDPAFLERFKKEAKILSSFRHQNIVYIIDFKKEDNIYFIVMDYIDGYTVKQLIDSSGPLSIKIATNVVKSVLNALYYAHRKGVIHRDLKCSNIMIDESGKVLVTDFGLAKEINIDLTQEPSAQITGTIEYMAPEQFDPKLGSVTERTDIYSLGVSFYEMVTGKPPFSGDSLVNVAFKHLSSLPESPRSLIPTLLPKAESIILKMLEKDPKKRYQSAEEALTDIIELEDILKYYKEPKEEASDSYFEIVEDSSSKKEKNKVEPPEIKEDPLIGKIIGGRYRIDKLLLKRVFSKLYFGTDLNSNNYVTIQVPNDSRPTFKTRIESEVKALKGIDNPLFIKFIDIILEDDLCFVIREYIEGDSVRNLLRKRKPSIEESIKIILDVLEGIQFLHENNIIHRDINSDTIIVTPEGRAKIMFLGLTRVEDASSVSSGEFLGVVQYTAPEQITESRSDVRSEIYSIGILLFELLTGSPPFDSPLPVEVMDMQLKQNPRFPESSQAEIPLGLQRIVLKALAKSPEQRFQTPKEMIDELNKFLLSYTGKKEETEESEFQDASSIIFEDLKKTSKASGKRISFSLKKKKDMPKLEKTDISKSIDVGLKERKTKISPPKLKPIASKKTAEKKTFKYSKPIFYVVVCLVLIVTLYFGFIKDNLLVSKNVSQTNISPPPNRIELSSFMPYEFSLPIKGKANITKVEIVGLPEDLIGEASLSDNHIKVELYSLSGQRVLPFNFSVIAYNKDNSESAKLNLSGVVLNKNAKVLSFSLSDTNFELVSENGVEIKKFETKPLMYNFNIYLPLRDIVTIFDGKLEYDYKEEVITTKFKDSVFKFYLFKPQYYVNDKLILDGNPIIEIDDKAYVSLIFVSYNLNLSFKFNTDKEGKNRVTITYF
jgi:serine/threonine protein kinase